jgi:hypothetical protein
MGVNMGVPAQLRRWRAARLVLTLTLLSLSGCSSAPEMPEDQLRQLIQQAETAVESRSLFDVTALIDPAYTDAEGRNFYQLRGLIAGYFFRHPSIFVISRIDRIELSGDNAAKVLLYAGLAGSAQQATGPLSGWRGNLLRFELDFRRNGADDWRLYSAEWRPATREDFVQ